MMFSLKYIKYLKLCIVSPAYEIIVELIMIFMFFTISFLLQNQGKQLYNFQLTEIISDTFKETEFKSINSINSYMNYLDKLVNILYEYNPSNNGKAIPYYMPYGAIRLNIIYNEECSNMYNEIENNIKCTEEKCTIDLLTQFYLNSTCMYSISLNKRNKLLRKYEGSYRNYFFQEEGINIDFTIDDYYGLDNNKNRTYIYNLLKKKDDITFLALLFNVYFPYDRSYGCTIAAIETVNSHINLNEPNFIFNSSILSQLNISKTIFVVFIIYTIGTILGIIKLIYEMNIKLVIIIHFVQLFDYVINILLLIFVDIYLSIIKDMPLVRDGDDINIDNINITNFHDFYKLLSLQSYITILISGIFLGMPVKILSLLSWSNFLSEHLVHYVSILFRMLPGIIVHFIMIASLMIPFVVLNYVFYRTKMTDYELFYSAFLQFLNIFEDISDIKLTDESSNGNSMKYSISQTEYALLFNIIEKIVFVYFFACLISYCVNAIEKAIQYESKKEDDEILKKMEDIEKLLEKEEVNNDDSLGNLKKQILWINFENNNNLYNKILNKIKDMLLFKNSNQVISFLKYLFALKPLMQFKSLKQKLCIVIQYSSKSKESKQIKEKIIDNIHLLLEWLNFVGCKIPVIIYSERDFISLQKIQVSTSYKLMHFTDNLNSIENFINDENDDSDNKNSDELQIVQVSKFTLYKINYIIVKDSKKSSSNNLNESRDNEKKNLIDDNDNNNAKLNLSSVKENKDEEEDNSQITEKTKGIIVKKDKHSDSSYLSKQSFSDSGSNKSSKSD